METVDITVPEQVTALHERLAQATFDLLFVNAGVANGPGETVANVSSDTFVRLMVTNALSLMRVVETLQDLFAPHIRAEPVDAQLRRAPRPRPAHAATHGARLGTDRPGRPRRPLTTGQSIPGVVDTIEAQAAKGGLRYLDYQGQTVRW